MFRHVLAYFCRVCARFGPRFARFCRFSFGEPPVTAQKRTSKIHHKTPPSLGRPPHNIEDSDPLGNQLSIIPDQSNLPFMQNKPNFPNDRLDLTSYAHMDYDHNPPLPTPPNQTQTKPNFKPLPAKSWTTQPISPLPESPKFQFPNQIQFQKLKIPVSSLKTYLQTQNAPPSGRT